MRRLFVASLLLASLGLAGCGGSTPTAPAAAAPAPAAIPQVAAQPAESIDVEIEGTWRGQMIVNDSEASKKLKAEQLEALTSMRMTMVFREDGTLKLAGETYGKPYESENRWDLVGAEGNKLVIKSIDASGKEKNIDLFFNDSESFDMPLSTEVANLGAMRFTRVR
jgi:hypothetical protein